MYGVATNHGTEGIPDSHEVAEVVQVAFSGPYRADDKAALPSIFDDEVTGSVGVYLRTIATEHDEQVLYIEQTRRGFGRHTAEHLSVMLVGKSDLLDPESLLAGTPTYACPCSLQTDLLRPDGGEAKRAAIGCRFNESTTATVPRTTAAVARRARWRCRTVAAHHIHRCCRRGRRRHIECR